MNKRAAGVGLLAVATFLYTARYIAAASFDSGIASFRFSLGFCLFGLCLRKGR